MIKQALLLFALAGAAHAEAPSSASTTATSTVTVFAAASLKDALDSVSDAFTARTGLKTRISYAGSMALAKQVEAGAPADVFFSADQASMDYLESKGLIHPESRANLLGNSLVLVAPRHAKPEKLPLTGEALTAALGTGKIATGDPSSVPVGKYARAALEKLGLWTVVEGKFAFTDNVRAALMFVVREEAPLGIVYGTDAKSEPKVKIVATFPAGAHPPIAYPVALTSRAAAEGAGGFLAFLKGKEAKAIFVEKGFAIVPTSDK